jgi:hypothetical protein
LDLSDRVNMDRKKEEKNSGSAEAVSKTRLKPPMLAMPFKNKQD